MHQIDSKDYEEIVNKTLVYVDINAVQLETLIPNLYH